MSTNYTQLAPIYSEMDVFLMLIFLYCYHGDPFVANLQNFILLMTVLSLQFLKLFS